MASENGRFFNGMNRRVWPMTDYEASMPIANKILNADGSVTTFGGVVILPADATRASEYLSMMPLANKFFNG